MLTGRMSGVGLSEAGRVQAGRLALALRERRLTAIVSSPLQRAQETAAPLAAACGLPVVTEPGIDEIEFGAWTGLEFEALQGRPEWEAWNRSRGLVACPGGETMLAAQARAVAAMHRVAAADPDGEIVLVSHQDVLKSLIAHVFGSSLDLLHRFSLEPAHRSIVSISAGDARVEALNLAP